MAPTDHEKPAPGTPGELVIYPGKDGRLRVQTRMALDTLWVTQKRMAELFGVQPGHRVVGGLPVPAADDVPVVGRQQCLELEHGGNAEVFAADDEVSGETVIAIPDRGEVLALLDADEL